MQSPAADLESDVQSSEPAVPNRDASEALIEARFYAPCGEDRVRCQLCPRGCVVEAGARGRCGVRENRGGRLYSLVYGRVSAVSVDPVEKKPLFHFLPGSKAFSIGTAGCNAECDYCQNWELAHARPEAIASERLRPNDVVELARRNGCASIAFTYNEPTVFAEFAMDTADVARSAGVHSIAVSNGLIAAEARDKLYGRMDAVKIDLKSFSEGFYREIVGARLGSVLDSLVALRTLGKWVEIVNLVIPTVNDGDEELRSMAAWIKANLGNEVPLHFTRFHPQHRMDSLPSTPVTTLERAREIAESEGLRFVYVGNVPGHEAQHTECPRCGQRLVERAGFAVSRILVSEGRCTFCQQQIAGRWQE